MARFLNQELLRLIGKPVRLSIVDYGSLAGELMYVGADFLLLRRKGIASDEVIQTVHVTNIREGN